MAYAGKRFGLMTIWNEPVAQPVEHLTFNQGVMGSNPIGLTTAHFQPPAKPISVVRMMHQSRPELLAYTRVMS